ncbi:enoyl-CoA hydratase/isomerase family protein [Tianweitania sp. BSSL-BM11]|uniref:Enoyl-CoA hydratase/isomerase family protein n=1 Tax=Tianweitania aestuarii TaxID=2814886 RepID=A0ABS5RU28_9HYPH|nr:enoyl-CoA hydratase-related protein [Tianweitania aestuarii]MBS9720558.1 enoyl-CoA hydratase/isomerase family protein [Tianweitania aestuarii]
MEDQAEVGTQPISLTVRAGVATITIDRPAKKNAITAAMWSALIDAVAQVDAMADARLLVLRGAGADFSAGADIAEFETVRRDAETARSYEALNARAFAAFRNAQVPTLAVIRGACLGGGFGLAISCDLRLAAPDARFSIPAAKLGLAYPADGIRHIVWAAGPQLARYLVHSGQQISAAQALDTGLLLEIIEDEALDTRVEALAASIAATAPLTNRATKQAINALLSDNPAMMREAERLGDMTFDSEDYAEGRRAFREKRKPVFTGR